MLQFANVETNSENDDGVCTVLYFDCQADEAQVRQALESLGNKSLPFSVSLITDPNDEFFSYQEKPTPVSVAAGWHRYECYGSC